MLPIHSKTDLLRRKQELLSELEEVEGHLTNLTNLEKPFVANVVAYSGHYSMQFKTEAQARKKYEEYASKKYFKNGLNYGVYLYQYNPDGTKKLLDEKTLSSRLFDVSKYV